MEHLKYALSFFLAIIIAGTISGVILYLVFDVGKPYEPYLEVTHTCGYKTFYHLPMNGGPLPNGIEALNLVTSKREIHVKE